MTFKETVSLCFICLAFAVSAQAADLPQYPRPPRPAPEEPVPTPEEPSQPPEEAPPRREPNRCNETCQPAYYPRSIFVNSVVANTYLDLVQVMGLGQDVMGSEVVSVEVQVQGGIGGSQLTLWANGQIQGSFFNPFGLMTLAPQYPVVLSCQPSSLMLEIRGAINIGMITVNLRAGSYNTGYGQPVPLR